MGALFIAFEHEIDNIDLSPHAVALVEHQEFLEEITDAAHVPSLMYFFHKSAEDLEEFVEDDYHEDGGDEIGELWFDTEEGIATVEALVHHFEDHPDEAPDGVEDELGDFLAILQAAEEHDIRWHFEMDFAPEA
jgi:hypothetical protein